MGIQLGVALQQNSIFAIDFYQAREEYNKIIPQARGQAEKTIKSAEGYALDRVNRAKGDAARFLSLYEEYSKAEDVTRRRLYLEAMEEL